MDRNQAGGFVGMEGGGGCKGKRKSLLQPEKITHRNFCFGFSLPPKNDISVADPEGPARHLDASRQKIDSPLSHGNF